MFEKSVSVKPGRTLQDALSAAKLAIEDRNKIKLEIDRAIQLQPAIEAQLQSAMESLGDAQADAALSGAIVEGEDGRKKLAFARDAADALAARIAGLRRKLSQNAEVILAVSAALQKPRDEFVRAWLAQFASDYRKKAEEFRELLQLGSDLSEGLGVTFLGLDVEFRDPQTGFCFFEGSARKSSIDPAVRQVKETADSIDKIAAAIRKARADSAPAPGRPSDVQPGLANNVYSGLSEAAWREEQSRFYRAPIVPARQDI